MCIRDRLAGYGDGETGGKTYQGLGENMSYTNIGIVIVISFIIAALLTKAEIPILRAKAGQNIREV